MAELTERDLDLIEVALESAAMACDSGVRRGGKPIDPLAKEYLHALDSVRRMRNKEPTNG